VGGWEGGFGVAGGIVLLLVVFGGRPGGFGDISELVIGRVVEAMVPLGVCF